MENEHCTLGSQGKKQFDTCKRVAENVYRHWGMAGSFWAGEYKQDRLEGNICNKYIKHLYFRIMNYYNSILKSNQISFWWTKDFKSNITQEIYTNGQWTHEKMLNIISHEGNAKLIGKWDAMLLRTKEWLKSGRLPIPSADKCCEATIILMHCQWEQKMEKPLWKTVCMFLIKLNVHLNCNPAILFLGFYPTHKLKMYVQKKLVCK